MPMPTVRVPTSKSEPVLLAQCLRDDLKAV